MDCIICKHPNRLAIDEGIRNLTPLSQLARHFGVSHSSLWRHKKMGHSVLTEDHAKKFREMSQEFNVLEHAEQLLKESLKMFEDLRAKGSPRDLLLIQDSIRKNIMLIDKVYSDQKESDKMKLETARLQSSDKDWKLTMRYRHGCNALTNEEYVLYSKLVNRIIVLGKTWTPMDGAEVINDRLVPTADWFPVDAWDEDPQKEQSDSVTEDNKS